MKRAIEMLLLLMLLFPFLIAAQDGMRPDFRYEVGIMIGEPTGLSLKYWIDRPNAIDIAAGWSFTDLNVDISVDYQYHLFFVNIPRGILPLFFGLGITLQIADESFFGTRIPLGGEYIFEVPSLSAFIEFAPELRLIPDTEWSAAGGIGLRFTF